MGIVNTEIHVYDLPEINHQSSREPARSLSQHKINESKKMGKILPSLVYDLTEKRDNQKKTIF